MTNKTKFLKLGIAVLLGAGVVGGLLYAQLSIPTNIDNSEMTIKKINLTVDGQDGVAVITLDGSSTTPVQIQWSTSIGDTASNKITGQKSSILWWVGNQIKWNNNIIWWNTNSISWTNSVIPWGIYNIVNSDYSFAAGNMAKVNINHHGTFIWSDNQGGQFQSTKANQYLIRAQNGVGINTGVTTTGYDLTVAGSGIVHGNFKANNMVADAYYYGSTTPDDALYTLGLSPRQNWAETGDIYYSSWNVGVGINNPQAKLHTVGTVRLQGLSSWSQATVLVVDTNGNVGIRTLNNAAFSGTDLSNYVDKSTNQTITGTKTFTSTISGSINGNATTATRLQTARTIAGVSFNGTTNIDIPFTNLTSKPTTLAGYGITDAINTSATQQTKAGNLIVGWDLTVQGTFYADTVVNRTVTDISVSGGVMPQATAPATYKRLGNSSNRWNELHVNNINAVLSAGTTSDTTVVVKDTSNNLKTRTLNSIAFDGYTPPVTSVAGKVWIVTLVKADVWLANVDNTSDVNKPISTATQTALNTKQNVLASSCWVWYYIRDIAPNGAVTCALDQNTLYTHPTSWVGAWTYRSVTVNTLWHVTAGTNPTTLAWYGITDAVNTTSTQTIWWAKTFSSNITISPTATNRIYMWWTAGGNFGIAYNSWNPDYGIFYTEWGTDYVSISPNGNIAIPSMKVEWNGRVTLAWQPAPRRDSSLSSYVLESNHFYGHTDSDTIFVWTDTNTVSVRGNLGVGTTTPANKLHVAWSIWATNWIGAGCEWACDTGWWYAIMYANGTIVATSSVTAQAFYYSSDISLKKDLTKITNPLDKILALNWYYFTWKSDDTKDLWVVAQEVEKVFPEAVKTDDKGLKSVKYGNLIAPIIESIKELYTKYLDQQEKISDLEQRITVLEQQIIK